MQRARYMTLETIEPVSNNHIASLPAVADRQTGQPAAECNDQLRAYTTSGDTIRRSTPSRTAKAGYSASHDPLGMWLTSRRPTGWWHNCRPTDA